MVNKNVQEWLDTNYPKEQRSKVGEIYLTEPNLEGELDLSDFTLKEDEYDFLWSGLKVYCSSNLDIDKLTIKSKPRGVMFEPKIIKLVQAQKYLNEQYPKEWSWDLKNIIKKSLQKKREEVTKLYIENKNIEGELDLSDFVNLKELNCSKNKLTSLNISKCQQLEAINCSSNKLTSLNFLDNLLVKNKLTYLSASNNPMTGSLVTLKDFCSLKKLDIERTDLTADLQYLPTILEEIKGDKKFKDELNVCGNSIMTWWETHPDLMKEVGKKEPIISDYSDSFLEMVVKIPHKLEEVSSKSELVTNNINLTLSEYKSFILRDPRPFNWEKKLISTDSKQLPLRLYNIQKEQIEETEGRTDISNYALISYVWGKPSDLPEKVREELGNLWKSAKYENQLNLSGYKSLKKAIEVCRFLKINHIWMDQLCINQNNVEEKNQEVPKMRQYYGNAELTLIDIGSFIGEEINRENKYELTKHIIKQIVTSPWFTRSWTYQEGLLSKQTVFMFDDGLVDGRMLAQAWVGMQRSDLEEQNLSFLSSTDWNKIYEGTNDLRSLMILNRDIDETGMTDSTDVTDKFSEISESLKKNKETCINELLDRESNIQDHSVTGLNKTLKVFATPLGWSYGAQPNQEIRLGLSQALVATKNREQTISVDKVYSILGLLPYGDKVVPEYKEWGHKYTKEELENALLKVMETAVENSYRLEPISWIGSRYNKSKLWWIPNIKEDNSIEIKDFVEMKSKWEGKIPFIGDDDDPVEVKWSIEAEPKLDEWALIDQWLVSKGGYVDVREECIRIEHKPLSIIVPVTNKNDKPIVFEKGFASSGSDSLIFIDMINKKVILGKEIFQEYESLKKSLSTQSLNPLWDKQELFGSVPCHHTTFQNSAVFQSGNHFYIWKDKQKQEVIKNSEGKWEYGEKLQAQIEQPSK
jgi:hypothetical protein